MIKWFFQPRKSLYAMLVANLAILLPYICLSAIGPYIEIRYFSWAASEWPPEFNADQFIRKISIGACLCGAGNILVALPTIYSTRKEKITDVDLFLTAMCLFMLTLALPAASLFAMYAYQAPFGISTILAAFFIIALFSIPATIAALVYWLNTDGSTTDIKAKRKLKFFFFLYITLITFSEIAGQWN